MTETHVQLQGPRQRFLIPYCSTRVPLAGGNVVIWGFPATTGHPCPCI